MPFSLKITRKGFFTKRTIDIGEMLENCKFKFGTYNDLYVLDEGKHQNNSCILYNPQHIGRGNYFDGNDDAHILIPEYNKAGIEEMTNSILRHA